MIAAVNDCDFSKETMTFAILKVAIIFRKLKNEPLNR